MFKKLMILVIILSALYGAIHGWRDYSPRPMTRQEIAHSHKIAEWQNSHPDEYSEMRRGTEKMALEEEGE